MASLTDKLRELTSNSKAKRLVEQAKEAANKPENRRKLEELKDRITRKR